LHLGCQGTPEKPDWIECEARREVSARTLTRLYAARLRKPGIALLHVRNPDHYPVATGVQCIVEAGSVTPGGAGAAAECDPVVSKRAAPRGGSRLRSRVCEELK
jgi:hypothetical protein